MRDRAILTKFFIPQDICRVYWWLFRKTCFPVILAAILNFSIKHKSAFISEMVWDRAISTKFCTHRVSAECTGNILQKSLSRHFLVAVLNLCVKRKTHLSGKQFEIVWFQQMSDLQVICWVYWWLFTKITFPLFLAAILNFCVKSTTHLSWRFGLPPWILVEIENVIYLKKP